MSNESLAVTLFEQANPIPDPEIFRSDENATAYLASINTRSSTMVQTEEKSTRPPRASRWLLAAAAIIIAIVGLAVILNQGEEIPPPATDPPVTSTTLAGGDPTGYWVVDGVRILALEDDGTYFWMSAGFVSDEGRWRTSTDRLTFVSSAASQSCEENATGSHAFSMNDQDTLRLTFSTDDCDGERDIAPLAGSRTFDRTEAVERP